MAFVDFSRGAAMLQCGQRVAAIVVVPVFFMWWASRVMQAGEELPLPRPKGYGDVIAIPHDVNVITPPCEHWKLDNSKEPPSRRGDGNMIIVRVCFCPPLSCRSLS